MASTFIRDLTVDPQARQARAQQGLEESVSARLLRPTPRMLAAKVNSAGTVTSGGGFSVSKGGTGIYLLTFTQPFAGTPQVIAAAGVNQAATTAQSEGTSASVGTVQTISAAGALVDAGFSVYIIGV